MGRWKLYDNRYADLAGLSVEQLRERQAVQPQGRAGVTAALACLMTWCPPA
ncbi:hypothetical protein [Streptomyces hokutonensis]|uniref:hypothetical protein n=1 Tax=Streptomyces hokutonensis TaxID=1306990 RepID=UPI0003A35A61|nr:hypothetical protein [Streptomyces hokutonensis]